MYVPNSERSLVDVARGWASCKSPKFISAWSCRLALIYFFDSHLSLLLLFNRPKPNPEFDSLYAIVLVLSPNAMEH